LVSVTLVSESVASGRREQRDPTAGRELAEVLPDDTFAQVCGRGGLVVETRAARNAALWRGHPWGSGWTGGGDAEVLRALLEEHRPPELSVPQCLGVPPGYRRGWGWGWHALRLAPPVQPGEEQIDWLPEGDPNLVDLITRAFPDAETPPGDPRIRRWFGSRDGARLVACAAELRTGPHVALLSSLTVDPSVRRRGWGAAVTAWFVRERLTAGAQVVGLGRDVENAGARALYERLGFSDVPYVGVVREG
jgi:GNAT superfamily N-acetyltransferase